MKKKKIVLISIIILLLLGIVSVIVYNKFIKKEEPIYRIVYYDLNEPGAEYDINVYNDNIKIIETDFCSYLDCESKTKKYSFKYSKENMDKLKTFIKSNFNVENGNSIEINRPSLNKYQSSTIQGLLNDEYHFEVNVEEYKYVLEYKKNDKLSYVIYFKNDKSILVKKLKMKESDIVKIDTYSIDFMKENLNILNNYIEKEIKNENSNIIYKDSELRKDEENIIKSIIENDESYLKK